uniref:Uncharacterized protein n=1 Tax=Prolemur simus TaxID=1328070 RepID=A0A8C9ARM1_PROSS
MDWLMFLLIPGGPFFFSQLFGIPLSHTISTLCTSCDEFVDKTCRRNSGFCQSKYPDFACQTKEVYTQHFTGEYMYQYSMLGCPKRCVEYVRITKWQKNVFFCCNESYCNSLSVKDNIPSSPISLKNFV